MRYLSTRRESRARLLAAGACLLGMLAWAPGGRAAEPASVVTVPGSTDFPESMTASADGTLFFSSLNGGRIFRAAPGASTASEWVKPGTAGLASVLGVLADDKSGLLSACSNDFAWAGVTIAGATPTALKTFELATGAPKDTMKLPQAALLGQPAFCNDIAVAGDGTVYVTDSLGGHILRAKPGGAGLEIWAHDARWDVKSFQLDGIAVLPDGAVYANIFDGDGLYRIAVNPDGSAGAITKLRASRPLFHSDGLRAYGANRLLMVEGETKGNLDLITINGDTAQIETIRSGFEGPVSLAQVGGVVYVLDTPLKYLFDPDAKGKTPPPFTATAVKLPQ